MIVKRLVAVLIVLSLVACGGIQQLKIPSKADYKVTGKLGSRGEVVKLKTREDVSQKAKYISVASPKAHLILFPGRTGRLKINNQGKPKTILAGDFLSRNVNGFAAAGFNTLLMDCPSDNCRENKGMLWGFRDSENHAIDVSHVIAYLKEKDANLPIWAIGVGRGTESAINIVIRIPDAISGLVLASSTTETTEFGTAVEDADLELVKIPVLAISHDDDVCQYSDPDDQEDILDDMDNAKPKKLVILEGGDALNVAFKYQRCYSKSQHMFFSVEDEAMNAITSFIKNQL